MTLLEARDRLGGRTYTTDIGSDKIDIGASWIHGIGPGLTDDSSAPDGFDEFTKNPIYTLAKNAGITTVDTWSDLSEEI